MQVSDYSFSLYDILGVFETSSGSVIIINIRVVSMTLTLASSVFSIWLLFRLITLWVVWDL